MALRLEPFAKASSWGSLLRAYEEWTISGNAEGVEAQTRRDFSRQLMGTVPRGVQTAPTRPADLYITFRSMAEEQLAVLNELGEDLRSVYAGGDGGNEPPMLTLLQDFWTKTLPAALDMPFEAVNNAVYPTLRAMERALPNGVPSQDETKTAVLRSFDGLR